MASVSFPWIGSKSRYLPILPRPPAGVTTIVEPFAGSLSYSIGHRPRRIIAADADELVRELWDWLRTTATRQDIERLARTAAGQRVDVDTLGLSAPERALLSLYRGGLVKGNLRQKTLYANARVTVAPLVALLPLARRSLEPLRQDFRDTTDIDDSESLFFIDPPYSNTVDGYRAAWFTTLRTDLEALVRTRKRSPIIVTFGNHAQALWPNWPWRAMANVSTAGWAVRGQARRTEWVATFNFPT